MAGIRGRGAARGKRGKRKKKLGKNEPKADRQLEVERAKANVAVWEARLKVTEFSRAEYRDAARRLAHNNEELTHNQYQLEKDMLNVIGFLRKQDMEKDQRIETLQQQLRTEKKHTEEESERLMETYRKQISGLEEELSQKVNEMKIIQSEFKMMKEFRRRKVELEKELDEIKDSLRRAHKDHKEALANMERHFLEEKQRLEKEAERKIMTLAEKAHSEAVMQLDDAGRFVFKENVRLKEAVSYHVTETRQLQRTLRQLQDGRKRILQDKETCEQLVEEKVLQMVQKNAQIQELQQMVQTLERALEEKTLEKERARHKKQLQVREEDQAGKVELQKVLEMKDREMNRVKKLSHNILQERTEVERFFLEALEQVKQEILSSRNYYQKMAQAAYHSHMMQAAAGTEHYPKIRTFHNKDHSTNDVSQDLRGAEKWSHVQSGRVDIGDLTWEQKEKVLRLLFGKMNGSVVRKRATGSQHLIGPAGKTESAHHSREPGEMTENASTVFITQHLPDQSAPSLVLPDIHMAKCQVMG